jgi:hypothetical protein
MNGCRKIALKYIEEYFRQQTSSLGAFHYVLKFDDQVFDKQIVEENRLERGRLQPPKVKKSNVSMGSVKLIILSVAVSRSGNQES